MRPGLAPPDAPGARPDDRPQHGATRRGRGSVIGNVTDWVTLLAIFLAPSPGLGVGGRLGIAFSDLLMALAIAGRVLHLLTVGLPINRLRRHAFLLSLLALFASFALISGTANGDPFNRVYFVVVASLLGPVILVATFSGPQVRVAQALALGCAFVGASTVWNPTGAGRAIGHSVHPNALGHSCVLGVAVALWLFDNVKSKQQQYFWLAIGALCVFGVVLSGSRGGTLGLLIGGGIYLVLRGNWPMTLAALASIWILTTSIVLGLVQLPEGNPIQRQLTESSTNTGSNEARRLELQQNFEDINDHPVFGESFEGLQQIHTVYFQAWIGGGAVCAFLLMLLGAVMLGLPASGVRRRDLAYACGAAALAVMWLVTNLIAARDQWVFVALVFSTVPLIPRWLVRRRGVIVSDRPRTRAVPQVAEARPAAARRRR